MRHIDHQTDLCVVGGGLAGMCAAISAARNGIKVVLMQDRPVLGGNASSEIRMWICGANGDNDRETGILEEIAMENSYRNPDFNYYIWDSILYEKVRFEENITLLLNCSCNDIEMDGNKIVAIKGWQLTTETWHRVEAKYFSDCSGDSILAPLSGANFRLGRESRDEFDEDIQPPVADNKTMGMSCLIQARETDRPQKFIPPAWAYTYDSEEYFPYRDHEIDKSNFWWIELGGDMDSIHDTEDIRDELLKIAFGVWDHIKNHGDHGADNWVLEWIGFLPGKRESRRYVGDHILTQNEIRAEGKFDDIVAYGGWTMDDHHPAGFYYEGEPTIWHPAPSPFGIPYRCLYSENIENLFFAGRNISVSHAALSATRVMATCATLGQAVGTAVSIALKEGLSPRGVYENSIDELKQILMDDDSYLPWNKRDISSLTLDAKLSASEGDPEPLRNGLGRPIDGKDNAWMGDLGASITYEFKEAKEIRELRFVFDSDLNREGHNMPCNYPLDREDNAIPKTMIKDFRVDYMDDEGNWKTLVDKKNNYHRLVKEFVDIKAKALRLTPITSWGNEKVRIFSWDLR